MRVVIIFSESCQSQNFHTFCSGHGGKKPYECEICDKFFLLKNLSRHIASSPLVGDFKPSNFSIGFKLKNLVDVEVSSLAVGLFIAAILILFHLRNKLSKKGCYFIYTV